MKEGWMMSLMEVLDQVKDFRRGQGKRYPLADVLTLMVLSIMSGRHGYREMASFAKANARTLEEYLCFHHGMPSYETFRTISRAIDFDNVCQLFNQWASNFLSGCREYVALDGKSIASTITGLTSSQQNFISLVSAFTHARKQVIGCKEYENKKTSEIATVEELLDKLQLHGVIFTMDALHCQKKH